MSTWVYIQGEPGLYTVGFHDTAGDWQPDSDHPNRDEASARVHWLNGGSAQSDRNPEPAGREAAARVIAVLEQENDPNFWGHFSGLTAHQITTRTSGLDSSTVVAALEQLKAAGAVTRSKLSLCWHSTDAWRRSAM